MKAKPICLLTIIDPPTSLMQNLIKRRTFLATIFSAIAAAFVWAPKKPKQVILNLQPTCEEYDQHDWNGYGATLEEAMDNLIHNIEWDLGVELDEINREAYDEALEDLKAGKMEYRYWNFSCPEDQFLLTRVS